jgi:hypothetical protein
MDEPQTTRIFFVTLNNVRDALPHEGEENAEIIWEMYVNGYMTRCLAMFSDIRKAEEFGSVRSVRQNFIDLAIAYDAFLAHSGGSTVVLRDAAQSGVDHMNIDTENATAHSFRNKTRNSRGYAWEHCLFIKGQGLYERVESKGYKVTQPEEKDYGLRFVEDGTPKDGETANKINITFRLGSSKKLSSMIFDESAGKYTFTQYGMAIDEKNPELFENVFVMFAKVSNQGEYHVANLIGSGDGYYACNGKIIPIQWHHDNETDPITFTLTDGTQLEQGVGNSYIAIVPLKSTVEWE